MKLDASKSKLIEFDISLQNIKHTDLIGRIVLTSNGIEYCFPVEISKEIIKAEIPALKDVIKHISTKMFISLELMAKELYLIPWKSVAQVKIPAEISAGVKEIEDKSVSKIVIDKIIEPVIITYHDEILDKEVIIEEINDGN